MSDVKLNMVYKAYINDEVGFSDVYRAANRIREINRDKIISFALGDEADAVELFDDTLMKLTLGPEVPDFERSLNVRLRRRRIDLLRRKTSKEATESYEAILESTVEEGTAIPDSFQSSHNLEHEVLMKEADHRQVIDSLVNDPTQVDPVTTLIVTEFPKYKTVTALAKALGLHHEDIKRKLRRLSRRYDANRFGDYYEYLSA
ncbi:hypothetical protein [Paenibacillus sp. NPDC057967]|uniref:hypothetical protein n=1 Tax=Paenibacillus sp. NPDC057967 TaxID=3346293 RepID=UPI0036DC33E6